MVHDILCCTILSQCYHPSLYTHPNFGPGLIEFAKFAFGQSTPPIQAMHASTFMRVGTIQLQAKNI